MSNHSKILNLLPYTEPFLFVDELIEVTEAGVNGEYTFSASHDFYKGHFANRPVTPGVILTETMAQIGVVCLGIYLLLQSGNSDLASMKIAMTSSEVEYLLPVYPGEKVRVRSIKEYFRFGKLKCKVTMENADGFIVCQGTIAGIIKS